MKRVLIYLLLIGFLSVVSSCDSLELIDEFKPFKINIPEETTVTVPVEGSSFEVYALTVDKNGERLGLSINNMGDPWSYGDYDYYENELCKITYNELLASLKWKCIAMKLGRIELFIWTFVHADLTIVDILPKYCNMGSNVICVFWNEILKRSVVVYSKIE